MIRLIRRIAFRASMVMVVVAAASVAYHFFSGVLSIGVFAGELLVLSLGAFAVRWTSYPGIFQSKPWGRLVWEIVAGAGALLAAGFIFSLRYGAWKIAESEDFAYLLGLEFKFERGSIVTVQYDAPKHFFPGSSGLVRNIRVIARDEFSSELEPVGTVIYSIELPQGMLDIPEGRLFQLPD